MMFMADKNIHRDSSEGFHSGRDARGLSHFPKFDKSSYPFEEGSRATRIVPQTHLCEYLQAWLGHVKSLGVAGFEETILKTSIGDQLSGTSFQRDWQNLLELEKAKEHATPLDAVVASVERLLKDNSPKRSAMVLRLHNLEFDPSVELGSRFCQRFSAAAADVDFLPHETPNRDYDTFYSAVVNNTFRSENKFMC